MIELKSNEEFHIMLRLLRTLPRSTRFVYQGLNQGLIYREMNSFPILKGHDYSVRYIHSNRDFLEPLKPIKSIVIFKGGELSLWHKNASSNNYIKSFSRKVTSRQYDNVKQVSHIPFLIQTLLIPNDIKDADVLKQKKAELQKIHSQIAEISKTMELSSEETKNQQVILQKSKEFLEMLLAHPEDVEINIQAEIEKFFANIKPALEYNKRLGAKIQLSRMDEIMNIMRSKESFDLNETQVIIVGPQAPRKGFIEKQYFVSLYEQEGAEVSHIHYAEYLPRDIAGIDIENDLIDKFLMQAESDQSSYVEEKADKVESVGGEVEVSKDRSDEEKIKAKTTLNIPSSSSCSLKKLNDEFLKAHNHAADDAIKKIKTIVIYHEGVLLLLKQDSKSNKFQVVASGQIVDTKQVGELISKWESEHEVELEKNRVFVSGLGEQEKVTSVTDYFSSLYQERSISQDPINDYIYPIESKPTKGVSFAEHVIKILASAELNKKYGKAVGDPKLMSRGDLLAAYAPRILLSIFHKSKTGAKEATTPNNSGCPMARKVS